MLTVPPVMMRGQMSRLPVNSGPAKSHREDGWRKRSGQMLIAPSAEVKKLKQSSGETAGQVRPSCAAFRNGTRSRLIQNTLSFLLFPRLFSQSSFFSCFHAHPWPLSRAFYCVGLQRVAGLSTMLLSLFWPPICFIFLSACRVGSLASGCGSVQCHMKVNGCK